MQTQTRLHSPSCTTVEKRKPQRKLRSGRAACAHLPRSRRRIHAERSSISPKNASHVFLSMTPSSAPHAISVHIPRAQRDEKKKRTTTHSSRPRPRRRRTAPPASRRTGARPPAANSPAPSTAPAHVRASSASATTLHRASSKEQASAASRTWSMYTLKSNGSTTARPTSAVVSDEMDDDETSPNPNRLSRWKCTALSASSATMPAGALSTPPQDNDIGKKCTY